MYIYSWGEIKVDCERRKPKVARKRMCVAEVEVGWGEVMDQCLLGSDRRFKSSVICSVVAGSEVF